MDIQWELGGHQIGPHRHPMDFMVGTNGHQHSTQWAPLQHPLRTKLTPSGHPMGSQWAARRAPNIHPPGIAVPPPSPPPQEPSPGEHQCPLTAGGRAKLPGEAPELVDAAAAAGGVEPVEEIVHPGGGGDGEVGPGQRWGWQGAGGAVPHCPPHAPCPTHTLGKRVAYWIICVSELSSQPALEQMALVPSVEEKL